MSVRDVYSQSLLTGIGAPPSLIPDPVFLRQSAAKTPRNGTKTRVGLALRSGYLEREAYMIELIIRHLQARGFEPILLSHSLHPTNPLCNDFLAFQSIAESMHIAITYTMDETLELYPTLDAVISMRLHASILSVVHGIPFYAISYGQKTRAILQSLELSFIQDAKTFNLALFKTQLEDLLMARETAEFAIRSKSTTIKAEILTKLDQLFYGF